MAHKRTEYNRKWREANREHLREYQKLYRKLHPERYKSKRELQKKWHAARPEYQKKWREANREHLREYYKRYRAIHGSRKRGPRSNKETARQKQYRKEQAGLLKALLDKIKGDYGCMHRDCVCPRNLPACCLDYHHLDRDAKSFSLGSCRYGAAKTLAIEVNKCTVLCAICHRMVTWGKMSIDGIARCQVDEKVFGSHK